jgi:uncharacterized membrane protein required for colicin V production
MGWIDIGIVAVLIGSGVLGFRRGFVRQALELIGLLVGVLLALYLTGGLVNSYAGPLAHYRLTYPAVFLAIVGVTLLVAQALGRVTSEIMEVTFFGWIDQVAGALAGVVKGALWLSICITILLHVDTGRVVHQNLRQSSLAGPLSRLLPAAFQLVKQYAHGAPLREPFHPEPRTVKTSI